MDGRPRATKQQPRSRATSSADAWGRGYATEAAVAARDYIYEHARPRSLVSVIAPENVRSQAVARRLGAAIDRRVVLAEHGPADVWLHPR